MQKLCRKKYNKTINSDNSILINKIVNIIQDDVPMSCLIPKTKLKEVLFILGEVMSDVVLSGESLQFPNSTGLFEMITCKQKIGNIKEGEENNLKIDQVATKQLWEKKPELKDVKYIFHINSDLTYNKLKFRNSIHFIPFLRFFTISTSAYLKRKIHLKAIAGVRYKSKSYI